MSVWARHWSWYSGKRCRVYLDIGPIRVQMVCTVNDSRPEPCMFFSAFRACYVPRSHHSPGSDLAHSLLWSIHFEAPRFVTVSPRPSFGPILFLLGIVSSSLLLSLLSCLVIIIVVAVVMNRTSIVKTSSQWARPQVQNSCLSTSLRWKFYRSSTDGSGYTALTITSWRQRERYGGTEMGKYNSWWLQEAGNPWEKTSWVYFPMTWQIFPFFMHPAAEKQVCYNIGACRYLRALWVVSRNYAGFSFLLLIISCAWMVAVSNTPDVCRVWRYNSTHSTAMKTSRRDTWGLLQDADEVFGAG